MCHAISFYKDFIKYKFEKMSQYALFVVKSKIYCLPFSTVNKTKRIQYTNVEKSVFLDVQCAILNLTKCLWIKMIRYNQLRLEFLLNDFLPKYCLDKMCFFFSLILISNRCLRSFFLLSLILPVFIEFGQN